MNQVKVLIVVSGGVVQGVYSSDPSAAIDLLDYDNIQFKSDDEAEQEFKERKKGLIEIAV